MKLIIVLFLMVLTPFAFTQNEWWKSESEKKKEKKSEEENESTYKEEPVAYEGKVEPQDFKPGKITVVKSPSIDKVIKFKSSTIPPNMGPIMDGYRIQLFFDQSRSEVDKARSTALRIDGETSTYIEYKAPNYLLLLGDYRSQLEAEKVRATLVSEFPEALIVEDKIYLPKIKEDEKEERK